METQSVRRINTVCVLCGSRFGNNNSYTAAASELGLKLAEHKINVVYGGGSHGLKGYVSQAAHLKKTKVVGVMPIPLADPFISGITCGEVVRTKSVTDNVACKIYKSDAFIALPGGFGTLEEIFCIISWAKLGIHTKPIGLLNVNNFFDGLLSFLDQATEKGFISPSARKILISASSIEELLKKLQAHVPQPDPDEPRIDWFKAFRNKRQKDPLELSL